MARNVSIHVREVGSRFGHVAVIRDAHTNRNLAETEDVRPWGFESAAYTDGAELAEARGWHVVSPE